MARTRSDALPIQQAVATASPSAWQDGLVLCRREETLTVAMLDGRLCALATRAAPAAGEPVAVHPVAELLAVGDLWFAARPVEPVAG
jgi:hypothetical protein